MECRFHHKANQSAAGVLFDFSQFWRSASGESEHERGKNHAKHGHAGEHHHAAWERGRIRTGRIRPIVRGDAPHTLPDSATNTTSIIMVPAKPLRMNLGGKWFFSMPPNTGPMAGAAQVTRLTMPSIAQRCSSVAFSRMMLVISGREMPVPSDMTSRAASSIGKLTASQRIDAEEC